MHQQNGCKFAEYLLPEVADEVVLVMAELDGITPIVVKAVGGSNYISEATIWSLLATCLRK